MYAQGGNDMLDFDALLKVSYGMYIVSTNEGNKKVGCLVNTVSQVTAERPIVCFSISKNNHTHDCIKQAGRFAVSVLSHETSPKTIGVFGFQSSKDRDKFVEIKYEMRDGLPVVNDNASAYFTCDVISFIDAETHSIVTGRVRDAEILSSFTPMTYDYYHKVIKGKAGKNAPTYVPQLKQPVYICNICGYECDNDIDKMPKDYRCPICSADKSHFLMWR